MSPLAQVVGFASVIVTIIVTIVGAVYTLTRAIHRLDSRLERLEMRIAVVEGQNRVFLQVFPKVIMSLVRENVLSVEMGTSFVTEVLATTPLTEIFKDIKPTINPLSQADLDRLRAYVERLKAGGVLNVMEAQDFYRISDIITREYPANENSWLLFLVGGFLLGALLSDAKKK